MEWDGEGSIAIVQGLDSTGVTLTVCNRSRYNSDRRRSSRHRIQINTLNSRPDMPATGQIPNTRPATSATPAIQRQSVDTSTGTDYLRINTGSQICDGRYTSSYKLVHCMMTPTSPPEAVSEFPPQRKAPCRNQGNFEIGGNGSGQRSHSGSGHGNVQVRVSTSRIKHYGGSQTWGDKGSSHRHSKSHRETEAFAHSLRKYPSMAPFRTASTDLIEKLIRYTQAKNFQELSRSTKSLRSLRQQKSSETYDMGKTSKHQQTYSRKQDDSVPNHSTVQDGYRGRTYNFKLYSPVSESRNLKENRLEETVLSTSYDYLKASKSPYGRSNHSVGSPSPTGSRSPEETRSPVRSPVRFKSPDRCRSPDGSRSPYAKSPNGPSRTDRPVRFERSVRDLSLNEMSKYIRSTVRQICNERPVVFQVCPKLKDRYNQHKKVCPNKNESSSGVMEHAGCQCTRADCYCSKSTQCVNNPGTSTNSAACRCKTPEKASCCRGMPCACASKSQNQAYYNKRIDEEISEWLRDVPVHSVECSGSKRKRETIIKELRKTLKQLAYDEDFKENAENEIRSFIVEFPLWNPGKDQKGEKLFKNHLADKLTERIVAIPKKPDRLRDIVKKWIVNMDFEDEGYDIDMEDIIDNFVNKLKIIAADRPACDIKYTQILRKEIIELLVDLAFKFDGDMLMFKKFANTLASEIVSIPKNVNFSDDTTDVTSDFEENVADWICEHGLCGELKKDPKLIEGLAKKLNKLKSQGISDEDVMKNMNDDISLRKIRAKTWSFGHRPVIEYYDDIHQFVDELLDELLARLSDTVQAREIEWLDELREVVIDCLRDLSDISEIHPRKFEKLTEELVILIREGKAQGNENLANDILDYLEDADLSIDLADLGEHVEGLLERLKILPSMKFQKEQAKRMMVKDLLDVIECSPIPEEKKEQMRNQVERIIDMNLSRTSSHFKEGQDDVKKALLEDMDDAVSVIDIPKESKLKLKTLLSSSLNRNFDKSFTGVSSYENDFKQTIAKYDGNAVRILQIDIGKKKYSMQPDKRTMSENMNNKPLSSNVKNTINDNERCPISEDCSVGGCLKKMLMAVASKHLNMFLPTCVCDTQSKIEKDVTENESRRLSDEVVKLTKMLTKHIDQLVDRYSIDSDVKERLKENIKATLLDTLYYPLSDNVQKKMKEDILNAVDEMDIPKQDKNNLKSNISHVLTKELNKLIDQGKDVPEIKSALERLIRNEIKNAPISKDKQELLEQKLKDMLTERSFRPVTDDVEETIRERLGDIVDDLIIDEAINNALKNQITNAVNEAFDKVTQARTSISKETLRGEKLKKFENKTKNNILHGLETAIDEAPISMERQMEVKKKIKDMTAEFFKNPLSDDVALKDSINEIADELNLPRDRKNKLKNELTAAVDENMSTFQREIQDIDTRYPKTLRRSTPDDKSIKTGQGLSPIEEANKTKPKESILQGIEKMIEESAVPKERTMELKKQLKNIAIDNLKKPFSDDVLDTIIIDISEILDDLPMPNSVKNKLKHSIIDLIDEHMNDLRGVSREFLTQFDQLKELENKTQNNILQGLNKAIDEAPISTEKMIEMKKKLKDKTAEYFKNPLSDDVAEALKDGINEIPDELNLPRDKKNKLKSELTAAIDENMSEFQRGIKDIDTHYSRTSRKSTPESKYKETRQGLRPIEEADKVKAKENILQGIEQIIDESTVPKEKKMELKRQLKSVAADHLRNPFSDDVQDTIIKGIADKLDELPIPQSEKNKLKRAFINMVNDHADDLRDNPRKSSTPFDHWKELENKTQNNILHGLRKAIDEAPISTEKKMEVKKKLRDLTAEYFKNLLSDDVAEALKDGIHEISDKLNLPRDKKNKLKSELTAAVDENMSEFQRGIKDIDTRFPRTSRKSTTESKYKETRQGLRPIEEADKAKAKENILQGIEQIIDESTVPKEKKMELKRQLKSVAADHLRKPFSDDVQDTIIKGIADKLDELPIPQSEKNKLKRVFINMVNEHADDLRDNSRESSTPFDHWKELENKKQNKILHGLRKATDEAPISTEQKMEVKKKLRDLTAEYFKNPLSDDVAEALKDGIHEISDELNLPKGKKNKFKSDLTAAVDENMREFQREIKDTRFPRTSRKSTPESKYKATGQDLRRIEDVDKAKAKESILQEIENIIEESAVPKEKKMELKRQLKNMIADNLKKPFSDNVGSAIMNGIANKLDELLIPQSEKNKLKRALTNMIDDHVETLRGVPRESSISFNHLKDLKNETQNNILHGLRKAIDEAPIPTAKKLEVGKKLNDMTAEYFKNPLSDDVAEALKDGIHEISDELNLPRDKKNKLKSELTAAVDDNMSEFQRGIKEIDTRFPRTSRKSAPESKYKETRQGLRPIEEADKAKAKAKENILQGIEQIIDESTVPKEKKMELKRQLKSVAADNLRKPFSDDVQDTIIKGIADKLDELPIPQSEKNKLKRVFINMVNEHADDLRDNPRGSSTPFDHWKELENKTQNNILHGLRKAIDEAPIPTAKQLEVKKKLRDLTAEYFKNPLSDDVAEALKDGIHEISDELNLPRDKKNKLKSELTAAVDENMREYQREIKDIDTRFPRTSRKSAPESKYKETRQELRPIEEADKAKAKENILQGIEQIIDKSTVPKEKKMELKRQLKSVAADHLRKPFSDDVQDTIIKGIADKLDELPIPQSEKNKLKRVFINMVNEHADDLRDNPRGSSTPFDHWKELENKTQNNILHGLRKAIDEAPIPTAKKLEVEKKLRDLTAEYFKNPLSDDVAEALKDGIHEISDELNLPRDKKNKLKSELTAAVDENMKEFQREIKDIDTRFPRTSRKSAPESKYKETRQELRPIEEADKAKAKENILQGIEQIIDESTVPKEKKMELKRQLKSVAADHLRKPFSDDVQDTIIKGIADKLDELPIPQSEKNKLKRVFINMVNEHADDLRDNPRGSSTPFDHWKELENKTQNNILHGLRKAIDEAPIPTAKKLEVKKKLRDLTAEYFKNPLSDDVAEALKDGIHEISDELNLPRDKKNKLKSELTAAVDENMREYQREIKDIDTRFPRTSRKSAPESKYKETRQELRPIEEADKAKAKENILQGIEQIIDKSTVPKEKKMELKRQLKSVAADHLRKPFSDDVQDTIIKGIADKLDELPIPQSEKNKLKRVFINMVNEHADDLRDNPRGSSTPFDHWKELENKTQNNILHGLRKAIDEAPIPTAKKLEVKKKLRDLTAEYFKNPLSDDVAEALKDGIHEISDELNLPRDKKNTLKSELTAAVDENMREFQREIKDIDTRFPRTSRKSAPESKYKETRQELRPIEEADKAKAKENILQGIEQIIDESTVPKEKKMELKRQLKSITADHLRKPFSDDVQHTIIKGIADKVDELPIPQSEKNKFKRVFINMVNEHADDLRDNPRESSTPFDHLKELENKTQNNILHGLRKAIDEAPIPTAKKLEVEKKLNDMTAEYFKNPLSDDVAEALQGGIHEISDELNLPRDKKNKLKSELTAVIDENMSNFKNEIELTNSQYIKRKSDPTIKIRIKRPVRNRVIDKSNVKESIKQEMGKSIQQSLIADSKKSKLKHELHSMISNMFAVLDETVGETVHETVDETVDEELKEIFEKYDIDPSCYKQLVQEFYKLLEIALKNGDFEDARRKLIEKLKREQNLSEEEASALVDELIKRAREIALSLSYKEAFAKAISGAVDQSTISNPDKNSIKNKLLRKLKQRIDIIPIIYTNDIKLLRAEILKDCIEVIDASSISTDEKTELKILLKEALANSFDKIDGTMDDEEVPEAAQEYKDIITKSVRTWLNTLPIELDPETATAVANGLASDIIDRLKYLQAHPEAISTDIDEIENLKYQVFRRMHNVVDPKDMPTIMDATEELYKMIMAIETPPGFPKFKQRRSSMREQSKSEKLKRDQKPVDRKRSTSTALSTENILDPLNKLIATNTSVRKQWTKNFDEKVDLVDKLVMYDETGQIDILSTQTRAKEETNTVQGSKSKKYLVSKPALKNNKGEPSRLSKIEKLFAVNNTSEHNSPFTLNPNEGIDEKEFIKCIKENIKTWLDSQVDIDSIKKKKIVEELTHDVVDRQKFLQAFGNEQPSQSDNLKYLKLLVHKKLNGLVPAKALKSVIERTNELSASIDEVPQLAVPPDNANIPKSDISQKSIKPTQHKLRPTDIRGGRARATNTTTSRVPSTVKEDNVDDGEDDASKPEKSNTNFLPGQSSTPRPPTNGTQIAQETTEEEHVKPTADENIEIVTESIKNWLESVPINLEPEDKINVINDLANDVIDRQKYLEVHTEKTFSDKEEIENLRFQVFKRLNKVMDPDVYVAPNIEEIKKLYKRINEADQKISLTPQQDEDFRNALHEEIAAILDDYYLCCNRRELQASLASELTKLGKSGADQDEIVENLIATLKRLTYLSECICDEEAEELAHKLLYRTKKLIARIKGNGGVKKRDFREAMMRDIGDVFRGCPMSEEKRKLMESQLAEEYAKDLGIPLEDSDLTINGPDSEAKEERYGMSFNGLINFIDTWLSSIHTDDDTLDEDENKAMKKDMAYNLIHKIGEMNVDPEIFNDDTLYEAVLTDELQNLFGNVSLSDEEIEALKADLIEKVLGAQHRAHDEIAGQTYKQNLRDAISKLLPDQRNISKEDKATMETLKDQLADAFIDLHYSGGNDKLREKFKTKISDEINTFCRDYLNRNPGSPFSKQKLNYNLYTALNKVPLPTGNSIRYEVEQARIRGEINDWIKELPLQPQDPTEVLARNKLVYVLSRKLFDIEVEGDDTENEIMRKEIVKFLNKLPLKSGEDNDTLADKLIDKLKASEKSRKYEASSNVTIDAFGNVTDASESGMGAPICPAFKSLSDKRQPSGSSKVCRRPGPKHYESFPPCTLSPEDRAHLERIRRRTCLSPSCVKSLLMKNKCDTGVGPRTIDAGSQTVLRPIGIEKRQRQICPEEAKTPRPCPGVPVNLTRPPYCQERRQSLRRDKPLQSLICPSNNERTPRPCPGVPANLAHQPCPSSRRESFGIEKPQQSPICPAAHEKIAKPSPDVPTKSTPQSQMRRHTISSSNISDCIGEVQPHIIIKQYYWNPLDNINLEESELQQTGRGQGRVSDPVPCNQPCSAPRHQIDSAPCDQIPYAQSTAAPCNHPSLDKLPQQNSSTQRGPCDQAFTCPEPKSQRQPPFSRYFYLDPQKSFQRSSQRDIPSPRSPCSPSPCMSPFGLNHQASPPSSPCFSKRDNECRMPKRDGLHDPMPCSSSRPSRKERVVELGSLDDLCNSSPKKRHSDQSDWSYSKFQEDENFWGTPMRRVILDEGIDESVVMEREQREEIRRCKCKERLFPKCGRSQSRTGPSQPFPQYSEDAQNLKRCSKCCGLHCPYPSFLYFRQ